MVTIGIDEVGRGCWAGPLVAAAVILDDAQPVAGLNDSKKLSKLQRTRLDAAIRGQALAIGIGWVWPGDIDISGITTAVKRAMEEAVQAIGVPYDAIIIDGNYNFLPEYSMVRTVVGGDGLIAPVSAASIVAKVARDRYMAEEAAAAYPEYGFERHVGYGTARHIEMLRLHGITPLHRTSYKPIRAFLQDVPHQPDIRDRAREDTGHVER